MCAGLLISSKAKRASANELAVLEGIYSRTMGKTDHIANALNAKMISTPARSFTDFISVRFLRNAFSSKT